MTQPSTLQLTAKDGHILAAYIAQPERPLPGGLILIHEIFGVTPQMKELADHFAQAGYKTIVPALFDRVKPNTALEYNESDRGRELIGACKYEHLLLDLKASIDALDESSVAVVGYCWGGGVAYLAACNLPINGGVSFYGTRLPSYLHQQPRCPFQFHFGGQDNAIPKEVIEQVREANPDQETHVYPEAGHAFANAARPNFHAESNRLAKQHLLTFLSKTLT